MDRWILSCSVLLNSPLLSCSDEFRCGFYIYWPVTAMAKRRRKPSWRSNGGRGNFWIREEKLPCQLLPRAIVCYSSWLVGEERNAQTVGNTCDLLVAHLGCWLHALQGIATDQLNFTRKKTCLNFYPYLSASFFLSSHLIAQLWRYQ